MRLQRPFSFAVTKESALCVFIVRLLNLHEKLSMQNKL